MAVRLVLNLTRGKRHGQPINIARRGNAIAAVARYHKRENNSEGGGRFFSRMRFSERLT